MTKQSQSSLDHVLSPFSKNKIMAYRGTEGRVAKVLLVHPVADPNDSAFSDLGLCRERTWAHRRLGVPPGGDSNEKENDETKPIP